MLKEFKKEESWNLFQNQDTSHAVAVAVVVLREEAKMTIEIETTKGEVAAEAWTKLSVINIGEERETTVDEVGVVVQVRIILRAGAEVDMTTRGGVPVGQWEVHPLLGVARVLERVHLLARFPLQREKVLIDVVVMIVLLLREVFHLVDGLLHLVVHPHIIQMLMNELALVWESCRDITSAFYWHSYQC